MTYNITYLDNSSGPLVLAQGIVENAGQTFGGALILFFFLIFLMVFKKNGNQDAFLASSFITSILAGLLWGVGILGGTILVLPFTLLIASLIMKVWGEG